MIWNFIFFITAFLYSSAGLGGASAYLAYLSLARIEYKLIPVYALTLNIISTTISSINWLKHARKIVIPIILVSTPAAFTGGLLKISEKTFIIITSLVLIIVGILMLYPIEKKIKFKISQNLFVILFFSALFGFLGGMIGIGCGVFLVPLLYLTGTAKEKEAASAGTIFILANSIFGLVGHWVKIKSIQTDLIIQPAISVAIGAFTGSYIASNKLPPKLVKNLFGIIVILIALISIARANLRIF